MNSKTKGNISESVIISEILKKGWSVSIPFGNNQRYDLIADDGSKLYKIQCKTACKNNGGLSFRTCSTNGFTGKHTTYVGQIDFFLVYFPDNGKVYRYPIENAPTGAAFLRIDAPIGGTKSNIKWAKDFLF